MHSQWHVGNSDFFYFCTYAHPIGTSTCWLIVLALVIALIRLLSWIFMANLMGLVRKDKCVLNFKTSPICCWSCSVKQYVCSNELSQRIFSVEMGNNESTSDMRLANNNNKAQRKCWSQDNVPNQVPKLSHGLMGKVTWRTARWHGP